MIGREPIQPPLRSDPHFATARAAIEAGDVGTPRTLRLGWTFPVALNPTEAAAELVDVALWLLGTEAASIYALVGDDGGPPLLHVNLLATNGALAMLEATTDAAGFPARREIHLLGSDGEIVHRTWQDDLLWSADGVEVLHAPAVHTDPPGTHDHGKSADRRPELSRAIVASLAGRESVVVTEEVAR